MFETCVIFTCEDRLPNVLLWLIREGMNIKVSNFLEVVCVAMQGSQKIGCQSRNCARVEIQEQNHIIIDFFLPKCSFGGSAGGVTMWLG